MSSRRSFIDLCLAGEALPEGIDDFIDAWHADADGSALYDYLGMTEDEYSLWLRVPDALPCVLTARRDRETLIQAVAKAYETMRRAPSGNDASTVARLRTWLKERSAPA